jgi:ABC-2 type transport system ATP-binding protein
VPAALEISGLSHTYDQRPALADLSLRVEAGEVFGLLGPNGSGKTTLFRILSTVLPVQAGTVRMFDVDVSRDRDAVRRMIGVVFQSASLDKHLSARENLSYHGQLFGIAGVDLRRRVDDALSAAGLSDRSDDRVSTFSGGMRQRIEIAKGLLHRPRLLLMDEPSTGLDPGAREDLWAAIRSASKAGITVVLTTHLMEEAERCDRLAILARGAVVACDTPDALKSSVGGEVITLATRQPDELIAALQTRIGASAVRVGEIVRLEQREAHRLIPVIIEAAPGLVDSVTVGRPTLNDVFIRLTGRTMQSDDAEAASRRPVPRTRRH